MKITIGIPCYNQQDYIAEAIQSALDQTIPCEVIVCNDGSTDQSGRIAESFGVKVIHQVNKGLPSARNTLIMNMTGDYLLPLDADDILKDNCIEEILKKIEETKADIIAPSFKNFEMNNDFVILEQPSVEDFKTANRIGYFSAIRKEALLEIGGYNPKMIWGAEDYDLWFDLLKRGRSIAIIKEPLVLYRVKENSMWTETQKHQQEFMTQINKNHPEVFSL